MKLTPDNAHVAVLSSAIVGACVGLAFVSSWIIDREINAGLKQMEEDKIAMERQLEAMGLSNLTQE